MKQVEIRIADILLIIVIGILLFQFYWKPEGYYRGYADGYQKRVNEFDLLIGNVKGVLK
jgi:hypothetical protein